MPSLDLPRLGDGDLLGGLAGLGAETLDLLHDVHTLGHGSEDDVLAVEPVGLDGAEEELRAVGVGAGVGHGQNARASVAQVEVLVRELLAVDGLAASAVAAGEVATLAHEVVDDAVEVGALEAEPLLAGAEGAEVLSSLRDDVSTESHLDAAEGSTIGGDVEENNGVLGHFEEVSE